MRSWRPQQLCTTLNLNLLSSSISRYTFVVCTQFNSNSISSAYSSAHSSARQTFAEDRAHGVVSSHTHTQARTYVHAHVHSSAGSTDKTSTRGRSNCTTCSKHTHTPAPFFPFGFDRAALPPALETIKGRPGSVDHTPQSARQPRMEAGKRNEIFFLFDLLFFESKFNKSVMMFVVFWKDFSV